MTTQSEHTAVNLRPERTSRPSAPWGEIVLIALALCLAAPVPASAQSAGDGADHLALGNELYRAGRFDEALRELNDHIRVTPDSPLAYYYAARIRNEMGQYSRARQNLEAAIADSAGFADATGLLALTLLREGRGGEALDQWIRFTDAVGLIDNERAPTVTDITDPEDYRTTLAEVEAARERERLLAEELARQQREQERLAREAAEDESLRVAAEDESLRVAAEDERLRVLAAETTAAADPVADIAEMEDMGDVASGTAPDAPSMLPGARVTETPESPAPSVTEGVDEELPAPLEDLTSQIGADVRRGMFTLLAVLVVLAAGIGGTAWWFRSRRRKEQEERVFSEEVGRLLDARDMGLTEEEEELEFEAKRHELLERAPAANVPSGTGESQAWTSEPAAIGTDEFPAGVVSIHNGSRTSSITDEVKALVSRLHREGKAPEEIALTADLTTTEVRLILAVREHKVAAIAEELQEEDEQMDRTVLLRAVGDLLSEGATTRDIARQLGVSLSEVSLAASILSLRNTHRP